MKQLLFYSHHKCASQWMKVYLARLAEVNHLSFASAVSDNELLSRNADLFFYGNSRYSAALENGLPGFHIVRNPLSLILSAYYSHLKTHPTDQWPNLVMQRQLLQKADFEMGIMLTIAFLERLDLNRSAGALLSLRQWNYADPNFFTIRMEDLVRAPSDTMRSAMQHFGCERVAQFPQDEEFIFEKFSGGRPVGVASADSHYRSGDPEEWKTRMPKIAIEYVRTWFQPLVTRFYPEIDAI